jgi:hypothetical protein
MSCRHAIPSKTLKAVLIVRGKRHDRVTCRALCFFQDLLLPSFWRLIKAEFVGGTDVSILGFRVIARRPILIVAIGILIVATQGAASAFDLGSGLAFHGGVAIRRKMIQLWTTGVADLFGLSSKVVAVQQENFQPA